MCHPPPVKTIPKELQATSEEILAVLQLRLSQTTYRDRGPQPVNFMHSGRSGEHLFYKKIRLGEMTWRSFFPEASWGTSRFSWEKQRHLGSLPGGLWFGCSVQGVGNLPSVLCSGPDWSGSMLPNRWVSKSFGLGWKFHPLLTNSIAQTNEFLQKQNKQKLYFNQLAFYQGIPDLLGFFPLESMCQKLE